ncbi:ABC transporter permease [Leifsonia xyli]
MQRFTGTLELLIGAPRSLVAPVFGFASATVTLGVYSVAAVTVVAFTFAHVDTGGVDVLRLTVSLLAVLVSLTSMGVLLAGLYVITRHAMEITNVLEFPMWLACGVIVPSTAIWAPISACGLLFPLGWAMLAVDQATAGGNALPVVAVAVCLSLLYAALGVACLHRVDMLARQRGTLRLR